MITFDEIISDNTHYGIIWSGTYDQKSCVIKMVILDTGVHYNKRDDRYYDGNKKISKTKYFNEDDKKPYLHTYYRKRKAMMLSKFKHEVSMIDKMSKLKLAPQLFHHSINRDSYRTHYGFIVMERMTQTIKNILLKRNLKSFELTYIESKIDSMHKKHIKHGDLKPSNIGVHLDDSGYIIKIRMIDWAKGETTRDKHAFDRDISTFYSHMKKNISER